MDLLIHGLWLACFVTWLACFSVKCRCWLILWNSSPPSIISITIRSRALFKSISCCYIKNNQKKNIIAKLIMHTSYLLMQAKRDTHTCCFDSRSSHFGAIILTLTTQTAGLSGSQHNVTHWWSARSLQFALRAGLPPPAGADTEDIYVDAFRLLSDLPPASQSGPGSQLDTSVCHLPSNNTGAGRVLH